MAGLIVSRYASKHIAMLRRRSLPAPMMVLVGRYVDQPVIQISPQLLNRLPELVDRESLSIGW